MRARGCELGDRSWDLGVGSWGAGSSELEARGWSLELGAGCCGPGSWELGRVRAESWELRAGGWELAAGRFATYLQDGVCNCWGWVGRISVWLAYEGASWGCMGGSWGWIVYSYWPPWCFNTMACCDMDIKADGPQYFFGPYG